PLGDAEAAIATGVQRRGWLESVAVADGVVANARPRGMNGRVTAKRVFEAAHLARAVAALTSVIDPELVVLGGGIGGNGDLLIGPMEKQLGALLRLPP